MIILLSTLLLTHATTIDGVRSVVNNENIISSEITIEEVIHQTDNEQELVWFHNENGAYARLVMAAMIRTKAETLEFYIPTKEVVAARAEQLRTDLGDSIYQQFLIANGLTNPENLLSVLRKRIIVERFVARNIAAPTTNADQWHHELEMLLIELRTTVRVRAVTTEE
jgi:hypothetical protein